MRFPSLLLLLLVGSSTFAFVPLTTLVKQRRLYAGGEFDYLLQETTADATALAVKSSSSAKVKLNQVVLTSSTTATTANPVEEEDDLFGLEGVTKVQQYTTTQQQAPSFQQKLKNMDLQDIVATLILPSIAIFAGGRWVYNKASSRVGDSLDTTLDTFANEMIHHDGNWEEMKLCQKEYATKLALLPMRNDRMIKRYLEQFAKKKTVSPQSISSLSYVLTLFNLSEEQAAKMLVSLCKEMGPEKISSSGKLLFLGSRVLQTQKGKDALLPIKEMIMATYREESVAETMVDTSQLAMAEAAYRTAVKEGGKNQSSLTPGWQVLGLEKEDAQRIFDEEAKEGFVSYREAMYGGQTTKYDKKGRILDKEGKLVNPEEADDDEEDKEEGGPVSNVYECGDCGYTLFVAQGREGKFYGSDFKCPECGAPKKKFKARDDMDE